MGFTLDTSHIRSLFPSLRQEVDGIPAVFLDNPGGTQVSQGVIDAMSNYLARHNANRGGAFWTARCSDEIIDEAHQAGGAFRKKGLNTFEEQVKKRGMADAGIPHGQDILPATHPAIDPAVEFVDVKALVPGPDVKKHRENGQGQLQIAAGSAHSPLFSISGGEKTPPANPLNQ